MTGNTFGGKACELARGRAFVAGVAGHCGVGADQRKAVLMVADGGERHLPALHGVARFTLRPKLAPVNIGVAITAPGADVRENQTDVALRATHPRMESPQRVTGLAVVKFH